MNGILRIAGLADSLPLVSSTIEELRLSLMIHLCILRARPTLGIFLSQFAL